MYAKLYFANNALIYLFHKVKNLNLKKIKKLHKIAVRFAIKYKFKIK